MTSAAPLGRRARVPPAERVRRRLAAVAGERLAGEMPSGYHRFGRVLVIQRPESLAPYDALLGDAWRSELGVETVLVKDGPVDGELRRPRVRRAAGDATETEVVEHGVHFRFDAARIMFAAGNRTERFRAGRIVRPGEVVADLFAGIGYFTIPAALPGRAARVVAVEKNPEAVRFLLENVQRNGVSDRVEVLVGDNRTVSLATGTFDRVFLGFLPSSLPWIPRAVSLLRASGGWLHVHTVADTRSSRADVAREVEDAVRATGANVTEPGRGRIVKPYGPGRNHVVVDVRAVPP